jgi:hypothetical protein
LPVDAPLDQPGLFQDAQVFGDGRLAHREGGGKVAGRLFALGKQSLDDGEADGIGEGAEDGGKGRGCHEVSASID